MKNNQTIHSQPSTLNPSRAFTLIELLVVIAIMGVLAGMLLAVVGGVKKKQYIWHAQAEMALLTTAIERYKAAYGFYPPSTTNLLVNPLCFELVGTVYDPADPANPVYTTLDGSVSMPVNQFANAFGTGVGGFMNCTRPGAGEDASKARNFLPSLNLKQMAALTNVNYTNIILITSVKGPDAAYKPLGPDLPDVNPWRYNSATPTNNPGAYDLWVQLAFGGKTNLVCNWSRQVQINNPLP